MKCIYFIFYYFYFAGNGERPWETPNPKNRRRAHHLGANASSVWSLRNLRQRRWVWIQIGHLVIQFDMKMAAAFIQYQQQGGIQYQQHIERSSSHRHYNWWHKLDRKFMEISRRFARFAKWKLIFYGNFHGRIGMDSGCYHWQWIGQSLAISTWRIGINCPPRPVFIYSFFCFFCFFYG